MLSQELKLKSRMSRVTSYDQLRLAKYDLLPDTDSIRLPNPCSKIFTFQFYSESCNFFYHFAEIMSPPCEYPGILGGNWQLIQKL